jgi:hypothetical protein
VATFLNIDSISAYPWYSFKRGITGIAPPGLKPS